MKERIQHICLAEDDPDDYYFFSKILYEINSGVKLTWFQNCEDLLAFLKTGSNLPCLIVLDMNMPRMDGQTCLEIIKNELELSHIPTIILSTAGTQGHIDKAHQAGAFKFLFKPYSMDEFRKVVSEILATPIT